MEYDNLIQGNSLTSVEKDEAVPPKMMKRLAEAYFSKVVCEIPCEYSVTSRQKVVMECVKMEGGQNYLYTLPIHGLGQTMTPKDYRAVLSYRLMIPIFAEGQACGGCNRFMMDQYGDHAVQCKGDPGIKHRHDTVRDGLHDILRRAGIASKKEADIGLGDKDGRLRPADILVYGWVNGRHTCVDLTGNSPLVGFNGGPFDKERGLRLASKKKFEKHELACSKAGYEFIPFCFTTFGGMGEEAKEFMKRVEKVTHHHLVCYNSTKFVLHRLSFMIQKGVAAQIVSRLPENFVD
ncbi:hypothetical protein ACHQM5_007146 [Ranunculus cassubicifolius]